MGAAAEPKVILVTGGAGFIGSHLVDHLTARGDQVINVDALTYAGRLENLADLKGNARHVFVQGSITDTALVLRLLVAHKAVALVHLAAESHVDRSIERPADFITTNIVGTYALLEAARRYWEPLSTTEKSAFRFVHVSTDEVFGSVAIGASREGDPYRPNSPYAASKASSDHLVRAYHSTFGLPTVVTNGSNTFGPRQFPEKLIPTMILSAIDGHALPVYGDGLNVRDWLFVEDHARAIAAVMDRGQPGESYNVGAENGHTNIEVVHAVCDSLNRLRPRADGLSYSDQIAFVADRPGHDRRYALDSSKLRSALSWRSANSFAHCLERTVRWYLNHEQWWRPLKDPTRGFHRIGLTAD